MDKFDEKVIGYDSIKETLRQIADVLKRPEAYAVETQGSSPIYRKEHSILETASL